MSVPLGLAVKTYRSTSGDVASPAMVEIENIRDESFDGSASETDVTTRAGDGWEQVLPTLKSGELSFTMNWDDDPASAGGLDLVAVRDAWLNQTSLDIAIADGTLVSDLVTGQAADVTYFRASMIVTGFQINRNLTEAVSVDVTMKISPEQTPTMTTTA